MYLVLSRYMCIIARSSTRVKAPRFSFCCNSSGSESPIQAAARGGKARCDGEEALGGSWTASGSTYDFRANMNPFLSLVFTHSSG
jgi:hypothetical protein